MLERIDKIVASQGIYSRSEVKSLISKKRIAVDGEIVKSSSVKADPNKAEITINGQKLVFKKHVYLMLNKPKGYVSATEDRVRCSGSRHGFQQKQACSGPSRLSLLLS